MASSSPAIQAVKNQPQMDGKDLESGTALNQSSTSMLITNKTLSSTANLAQLLPTGTVLAFESLSSSFTDNGQCHTSNKFLTALLIYFCLLSCVFFSFTDSLVGKDDKDGKDSKLYYGLATFKDFYVFNFTGTRKEFDNTFPDRKRLKIRKVDYVHAIFSSLVFLSVAFSDTGVQRCYFPSADTDVKELLVNLPIGAAFLASFVFIIFPTTRKGIGYTNGTKQKS